MTQAFEHGYALLIAVNENSVSGAELLEVLKDVEALNEVLTHPQRCGYLPDNIKIIIGTASTRAGIMDGLDWLKAKLEADTSGQATAVMYYTGHGHVENGNYYLIPYDVNLNRLKTSAIRAEDFAADIAALQPKRLLVMLDCCHAAGTNVKELIGLNSAAIPAGLFMQGAQDSGEAGKGLDTLAQGAGRAVLSSSQAGEKSYLRKDGAMSIFTYHVVEALTGHAQPQSGATEVLVSDVMGHVTRCVPASAKADWQTNQHPDHQVSGNFPVVLLLGGKGLPSGQPAPDPLDLPLASKSSTQYQATVKGSGAIAQGKNAVAVGERGVFVGRDNKGNINTGKQIKGDRVRGDKFGGDKVMGDKVVRDKIGRQINMDGGTYVDGDVETGGGDFVGRNKNTSGVSAAELAPLFAQLIAAMVQQAPADKQAAAVQQVQALQAEVTKGAHADDNRVGKIIEGLAGMVPGAIGALVGTFAHPILGGIAGPVTKYVLNKLKGQ